MLQQLFLVVKVFAIAFALTLVIKYLCVELPIPFNSTSALIGVLLPPGIMIVLLLLRSNYHESNQND